MADQEKETRRTRRAQRREQAQESGSDPRPVSEGADEIAEEPGDSVPAVHEASKRAVRGGGQETARDRNRRVREQAAEERRDRRRPAAAKTEDVGAGLDATEMVDDVLVRTTHTLTRWVRQNSMVVQSGLVLALLGVVGFSAWSFYARGQSERRSDTLFVAMETGQARVGESPELINGDGRTLDPRPSFSSEQERLTKAEEAFRGAAGDARPIAVIGTLGLAGTLYDQKKFDEAKAAYEQVKKSRIATQMPLVKGRSIEGIGLCEEAKGNLDQALKVFGELEAVDHPESAKLGLYHRARLALAKRDTAKAKELLAKLKEKLSKVGDSGDSRFSYLSMAAAELGQEADPGATTTVLPGMGDSMGLNSGEAKQRALDMQRWAEELSKGNIPADLAESASSAPAGSAAPATSPSSSGAPVQTAPTSP